MYFNISTVICLLSSRNLYLSFYDCLLVDYFQKYYIYNERISPIPNCEMHIIIILIIIDTIESIIPIDAKVSFLYFCTTINPHISPGITAMHVKNDNIPQINDIIYKAL